jgi:hypothetical protein
MIAMPVKRSQESQIQLNISFTELDFHITMIELMYRLNRLSEIDLSRYN